MTFLFNPEFYEETFSNIFNAKDPDSFYMYVRVPPLSIHETKIDIGYINTYYCKHIRDTGSYFIIINSKFSNTIFAISKTNKVDNGTINKVCSSGDDINIIWDPFEYPLLQYTLSNSHSNSHIHSHSNSHSNSNSHIHSHSNVYDKTKKLQLYIKIITSF